MTETTELKLLTRLEMKSETFMVGDNKAFIITPTERSTPTPWIWYAPTFPEHPDEEKWMFEQLLEKGIAIAGVDVGESFGSPAGRRVYSALYTELVNRRGLSKTPCLLARSRGGLMLYNWAAENPDCVSAVAGIYTVCDITSYPGLDKACGAYDMTEEQLAQSVEKHNPIDRIEPLAKAGVPVYHIHGDSDSVVPIERNSGELAKRYRKFGGEITLEIIEGGGHDISPNWFRNQKLVDFMIEHAK